MRRQAVRSYWTGRILHRIRSIRERRQEWGLHFSSRRVLRDDSKRLLSLAAGRELDDTTCCELLSSVGLCVKEYINREADATLSGGEMKRIEIATVLAKDHKICVFDEPEAGIDLWSFSMLIKRFEQIHKEKKQSLILISHQERIIRMADRIMVIGDGKVEAVGTADEIVPILFGKKPESCGCRIQKGGELYER